jgi:hypothetical protein
MINQIHSGTLVSVKVESWQDAGGSDIILTSWDAIEALPTIEN